MEIDDGACREEGEKGLAVDMKKVTLQRRKKVTQEEEEGFELDSLPYLPVGDARKFLKGKWIKLTHSRF